MDEREVSKHSPGLSLLGLLVEEARPVPGVKDEGRTMSLTCTE